MFKLKYYLLLAKNKTIKFYESNLKKLIHILENWIKHKIEVGKHIRQENLQRRLRKKNTVDLNKIGHFASFWVEHGEELEIQASIIKQQTVTKVVKTSSREIRIINNVDKLLDIFRLCVAENKLMKRVNKEKSKLQKLYS